MKVKALQYMYYDRRGYNAGEEYEMDDRQEAEIRLLVALGKLEIVKAKYETPKLTEQHTADLKPEPDPEPQSMTTEDSSLVNPDHRRFYRRRDMRSDR